jgi:hypothetical protein
VDSLNSNPSSVIFRVFHSTGLLTYCKSIIKKNPELQTDIEITESLHTLDGDFIAGEESMRKYEGEKKHECSFAPSKR